VADRCL